MKALILAAGRGSRMKNLTDAQPKCMVPYDGRPLIEWQLQALQQAGIQDIGIVTGYREDMLRAYGLPAFHNPDWACTQMVSSLVAAEAWLASEPCVVSYSDIVYEASAVASLMACEDDIAITYDENWLDLWTRRFGDPLLDAETFRFDAQGYLIEIGNKPSDVSDVMGQYMGLLKFSPTGWAAARKVHLAMAPEAQHRTHMTGLLQAVLTQGACAVKVLPYRGFWCEFDSADDLGAVPTGALA
jgi:L-glutamine-phosphate cytidylyltransferase